MKTNFLSLLSHYGIIEIDGSDAEKFLQGQLTCDMQEVTSTQYRFGAYCNQKGRVLASFRIYQNQQRYFMVLPKSIIPNFLSKIKKYAVFSKVNLKEVSNEWQIFGCAGEDAENFLREVFLNHFPNKDNECCIKNHSIILRITDNPYFILITPSHDELLLKLKSTLPIKDEIYWRLIEIKSQIPQITPVTYEMFTPHMLNLPQLNAVSFTKGCYLGQEIIARTHYLGKSKRELKYLEINMETPVIPGQTIDAGVVVDVVGLQDVYRVLVVG